MAENSVIENRVFVDELDADILAKIRADASLTADRFVEKDVAALTPRVIAAGDPELVKSRLRHLERIGLLVRWSRETTDGEAVRGWYVPRPERENKRKNLLTAADAEFLRACGVRAE